MKKITLLLFILMMNVLFFANAQSKDEASAKVFANKLFYAVKKNDLEGFKAMSMTLPDWQKTLALTKVSKEEKATIQAAGKADIVEYHERKKFDKMQKLAKREFIKWDQIIIDSHDNSVTKDGPLTVMSFKVHFRFEARSFVFTATDCVKTPTGWKMRKGADITVESK